MAGNRHMSFEPGGQLPITRHREIHCPYCGAIVDAAVQMDGRAVQPSDGDYSGCNNCFNICAYVINEYGVGLRKLTLGQLLEFVKHYPEAQAQIQRMKKAIEDP